MWFHTQYLKFENLRAVFETFKISKWLIVLKLGSKNDYRDFMNALKLCGQFGVCEYVHIAVKKVQCVYEFLKQAHHSYSWFSWIVCQYPFFGSVPSPFFWIPEYCHFSPLYVAFSPQFIDPGVGNPSKTSSLPGHFERDCRGEAKRTRGNRGGWKRKSGTLFSLGFYTMLCNLVKSGSSHVGRKTKRKRWSRYLERRWSQRLFKFSLISQSLILVLRPMKWSVSCSWVRLFVIPWSVHGVLQARILKWVAIPSSRRSSGPRDQSRVSCTAHRFFTIWGTREAPFRPIDCLS